MRKTTLLIPALVAVLAVALLYMPAGATTALKYQENPAAYVLLGACTVSYPCQNLVDGNWKTSSRASGGDFPYSMDTRMNYTRPALATKAIWQVKSGSTRTYNLTVPTSCLEQVPVQFKVDGNPYNAYTQWYCYDGSGWDRLHYDKYYQAYEEGIWWEISGDIRLKDVLF